MEPDGALDPWAVPAHATRKLPRGQRPRRPWWVYAGTTLAVVVVIAGVAVVGAVIFLMIGLSQWGNNK
jgi:hypothetical protein